MGLDDSELSNKKTSKRQKRSDSSTRRNDPYIYDDGFDDYHNTTTPVVSSHNMSIALPPHIDSFPQPSPAACGKRKQAELAVAQVLAASSTQDMEGAQVLSMIKDVSYKPGDIVRKQKAALTSLSIINPDILPESTGKDGGPGTPWETGIRALEAQQGTKSTLFASRQSTVSTPSEQRDVLNKIRAAVSRGDVDELESILQSTEATFTPSKALSIKDILSNTETPVISGSDTNESKVVVKEESSTTINTNINSATKKNDTVLARMLNRVESKTGNTILIDICSSNFPQELVLRMCSVVVGAGASASIGDSNRSTCLHKAAAKDYEKVGQFLLNKGCPPNIVNADGDTAMHVAAKYGNIQFLEILTKFGANCHIRNANSRIALDVAGSTAETCDKRDDLRRIMLSIEPRLRTLILYHDDCLEHCARKPGDWESPDRLKEIMSRIQNINEFPEYELEISTQFDKAAVELLERAHSAEYIAFVDKLSKEVMNSDEELMAPVPFTPQVQKFLLQKNAEELKKEELADTSFSQGTLTAARRAAGAVAHAVDRVMLGRNRNAFCVVRPPGHHAGYDGLLQGAKSCGFCIFNSVAAGALHALENHSCERVAIIDLDIHHGNGTEDIVRRYTNPSRLFFFSVHLYDKEEEYEFFPGSGTDDDVVHNIINVPVTPMWHQPNNETRGLKQTGPLTGRKAYKQAILQRLIPSLRAFNPSLILLSAGFDPAAGDVGNIKHSNGGTVDRGMDMGPDDFAWVTTEIMKVADICSGGRIVSCLEGGYGCYIANTKKSKNRSSTPENYLDRSILAAAAMGHLHRLVNPYDAHEDHEENA